jgi:uncharacterized LabA/DUF88 family protein
MSITENKRFALLIDADNAQAKAIGAILTEAARYGDVSSRRCYGDWTNSSSKSWKEVLNRYAIQPIQQFAYTFGKNATDSALIIDAMDLLYTGKFNGFFLVSSDSDFTKLATRLREAGLEVIGIGRRTTPEPFRAACNKFIFTETIMDDEPIVNEPTQNIKQPDSNPESLVNHEKPSDPSSQDDNLKKLRKLIKEAIESASGEDGWATLAEVGSYISRIDSSFDPRNYGANKLGKLVKSLDYIESQQRDVPNGSPNTFIRFKLE